MVNSKADKTGGHTVHAVSAQGGLGAKQKRAVPAYTQVNPPVAPPPAGASVAGAKALALRAKKILSPLADPTQSIAE